MVLPRVRLVVLAGTLLACGLASITDRAALADDQVAGDAVVGAKVLSRAFRDASRRAIPSVVTIIAFGQQGEEEGDEGLDDLGALTGEEDESQRALRATGLGSGVIINESGTVLTNHHVIRDAARIVVKLQDGTELQADDIQGDPQSDLATLKIQPTSPLTAATLGDSQRLEIGDWVLAIGSPFQLEATVSAGIISAKDRRLPTIPRAALLQTDAVINPGNSGGPLVNLEGEVIGINTAIATRNGVFQGIGFAIPMVQAEWIADELLEHGKVRRSRLGIQLAALKRQFADVLDLEVDSGVVVYQISKDSPAEKAGFEKLDVITHFAGRRVKSPLALRQVIERLPIDQPQTVTVIREGQAQELSVTLEAAE